MDFGQQMPSLPWHRLSMKYNNSKLTSPLVTPSSASVDELGSVVSSVKRFKMKSRRIVVVTGMVLVSVIYLMTYTGQGSSMTHATIVSLTSSSSPDNVINPHSYNYVINNPDLCRPLGSDDDDDDDDDQVEFNGTNVMMDGGAGATLDVVIMVVTAPNNFATRMAIRRTWGTVVRQKSAYRLAFVMGLPRDESIQKKIVNENREYEDIVQEDFLDTYQNLTIKSVMILKWVDSYCLNSRFVVKIDDDCFLHPQNMWNFLKGRKESKAIYGRMWQKVKPIRNAKDKWHVTAEEYSEETFPDYTGGPTYAITTSAVSELYTTSLQIAPIVLEDVYVTGLCADKAKVTRVTDTKFGMADAPNVCASRSAITYHRVRPESMYLLWWLINDSKFDSLCNTKSKDTQCYKMSNTFVDLTNLVIKNVHG